MSRIVILSLILAAAAFGAPPDDCCEVMASRSGSMHGMMGHGMSCRQMADRLVLAVEDIDDGAVIRVRSKDPVMVDQARGMAHMMSACIKRPRTTRTPDPPSSRPSDGRESSSR